MTCLNRKERMSFGLALHQPGEETGPQITNYPLKACDIAGTNASTSQQIELLFIIPGPVYNPPWQGDK